MSDKYTKYVKRGRQLIKEIENLEGQVKAYQAEISKMALEVCEIRHGGKSTNIYTLKDYAQDIGMTPKTLQNWVRAYRLVLIPLNKTDPTPTEWKKARKVDDALKIDREQFNRANNSVGTRRAYKETIPVSKIKELYDEVDANPVKMEVTRCITSAKHIKFILEKRDLKNVDDDKILRLMEILDEASELANQYLTDKKKRITSYKNNTKTHTYR